MGPRTHPRFSLDRIDVHGDYTPENCRWADRATQARNKTSSRVFRLGGECMNLSDLAARIGSKPSLVHRRIARLVAAGFTEDGAAEYITGLHSVQKPA